MKLLWLGTLVVVLMLGACSQSIEQDLRPDQATPISKDSQTAKNKGLVVTDNPYTISSERLEQMNKGGFGAY